MRPLGFESPAQRFRRALRFGLILGAGTAALFIALLFLGRNPPAAPAMVLAAFFGLGFLAGMALGYTWPEYAPPQIREEGDAGAGVPARLIPPVPTRHARIAAELPTEGA